MRVVWLASSERQRCYTLRMLRTPPTLLLLGLLIVLSFTSRGGQAAGDKVAPRGRILGIGGVFFKSANRNQSREWYSKHLGLTDKGGGAMLPWREREDPSKEHVTVVSIFPSTTDYFGTGPAPFMVNYIVDDLDALIARLQSEGVKIDPKRINEAYGKFAWIYDADGNKVELWQPVAKAQ